MEKILPDKYIRKAIWQALDGIIVNGNTINCYDTRVTGANSSDHYILMTTQTNTVEKSNKCEDFWNSTILLDIVTRYHRQGNTGSRLLADDILDEVRDLTNDLVLDGGLDVIKQTQSFPNDLNNISESEMIFRKFMRLELTIK